jgi:hypothetical protein
MNVKGYKAAGWAAAIAVTAFVFEIACTITSQIPAYAEIISPPLVVLTIVIHIAFASYATYCLRSFLNERYEFHAADTLIMLLVVGGIVLGLILVGSMFFLEPTVSMFLKLGAGVPLGVISVLFGYRLLAVNGTIGGLKKPLAYSHIIAPLCFLSIVLAPLGLLILLLAGVLLALIFFRDESPEFEFV